MTAKRFNNIQKISLLEENFILKQKLKEFQECEEQLQRERGTYSDVND